MRLEPRTRTSPSRRPALCAESIGSQAVTTTPSGWSQMVMPRCPSMTLIEREAMGSASCAAAAIRLLASFTTFSALDTDPFLPLRAGFGLAPFLPSGEPLGFASPTRSEPFGIVGTPSRSEPFGMDVGTQPTAALQEPNKVRYSYLMPKLLGVSLNRYLLTPKRSSGRRGPTPSSEVKLYRWLAVHRATRHRASHRLARHTRRLRYHNDIG